MKYRSLIVAALCIVQAGCSDAAYQLLGSAFIVGISLPDGLRQLQGEESCRDQECDQDRWLLVEVYRPTSSSAGGSPTAGGSVSAWLPGNPAFTTLEFIPRTDPVLTASMNPVTLDLATVARSGTLYLSSFASSHSDAQASLNAVGVAWSNAGDRLAVVRCADTARCALEVMTPELDTLQTIPLEPTPPPDEMLDQGVAVSWNTTDTLVVVSAQENAPLIPAQAPWRPGAQIVNLETGAIRTYSFSTVYFIGESSVVATDRDCHPCTVVLDVDQEPPVRLRVVRHALMPLASHAPRGTFATYEPQGALRPPLGAVGEVALRTADLGPYVVLASFRGILVIVPLCEALPALVAAGYGPGDIARWEEQGCPQAE